MKQQLRIFLLPMAFMLLGPGAAHAGDAPKIGGELTCSGPVSRKDTGESLYQRFGDAAGLNSFQDRNYNSFVEVELFSDTEAHLDVKLEDNDFVKNVAVVEVGRTAWSVKGLKVGMSLEEVAAVNGGPFKFVMTDSDIEGNGTFPGGRLDRLDGGCRLKVMFALSYDPKIARSIRGKEISSDNADLVKLHPTVGQLSILWPRR
jgi:hypothetical protein